MRPRPRAVAGLLLLAVAICGLTACRDGDQRSQPEPFAARIQPDPVLRLGVAGVASLDPALTNPASPSQTIVADLLYDGLTAYDTTTGATSAAVAAAWTISGDGLVWTFHLDPAARFSNGDPITPADVKTSLERVAALGVKSVAGLRLSVVDGYAEFIANPAVGLRGLQAVDATTFVVQLTVPFPSLDRLLSDPTFGIVPASSSTSVTAFAGAPVGSGPFAVRTRTTDVIEATRREGATAALSGVTLHLFPDPASAHAAFVRGDVDVSVLGLDEVAVATGAGELVVSAPHQVSLFYGMNVKAPALTSIAVRQAIVKAVDQDAIRRSVFGDAADTMTGLLGPAVDARRPDACGNACAYDPDGAKFVLAQAFPEGGVPLVHVDYFDEPSGREAAIAGAVSSSLNAVGIPTELRAHPFEQYGAVVTSGNAELFRFGWIGAFPAPDAYLDPLFASNGTDNVFALADADVDATLAEARSATGDAAQTTAVLRAEDRILELKVVVPIVQYRTHLVVSPEVRNVVLRHDGTFDAERITLTSA